MKDFLRLVLYAALLTLIVTIVCILGVMIGGELKDSLVWILGLISGAISYYAAVHINKSKRRAFYRVPSIAVISLIVFEGLYIVMGDHILGIPFHDLNITLFVGGAIGAGISQISILFSSKIQ